MKNVHVIKTDKPSRLYKKNNVFTLGALGMSSQNTRIKNHHIYITNSEKPKSGDYAINVDNELVQLNQSTCIFYDSKVVLCSDKDLIKDGVQAIDNEFLEWFVKNPSCEFVNVKDITTIPALQLGSPNGHLMYKIIIPREEPSFQDSIENSLNIISIASSMFGKKEEPKQETLKEFTEQDMINFLDFCKSTNREKSFYEMKCLLNRENIESKELLQIWKEQNLKNK
jgi:hypothetical protein